MKEYRWISSKKRSKYNKIVDVANDGVAQAAPFFVWFLTAKKNSI